MRAWWDGVMKKKAGRGTRLRMRDRGWIEVEKGWEAKCLSDLWEEVLCVRNRWSGAIAATLRFPKGTLRDAGPDVVEAWVMGLVRKAQETTGGGPAGCVKPASFKAAYPTVCDYLFDDKYENGELRQRSTITVMAGDLQGFKLVLNDRAEAMSLWVTGDSIDECLLTMETMLHRNDAPWRRDKVQINNKKK